MKTLDLIQGSEEWQAARAKYFTASEAPAMLGLSKYQSRQELLRQKATGHAPEISEQKQRLFDRGHEAEAAARPIVEETIGDELFPATGVLEVEGLPLLASFDGITMDESVVWENKLRNEQLVSDVENGMIGDHYWPQLEQQLLVSGADKAYFTTSDGTPENTVGMWYTSIPKRRQQLIAGWKQFAEDLANYQHVEVSAPVTAAPIEGFGALVLRVEGKVLASNLDAFQGGARAFLERLPKADQLKTDQDFADAAEAVKKCAEAEDKIESAKALGLAQMGDVDAVMRVADQIKAEIRAARLSLEKVVKVEKENRKASLVRDTSEQFANHLQSLLKRTGVPIPNTGSFVGVIKGLSSLDSIRDKLAAALATAKIEANAVADRIEENRKAIPEDKMFLFPDFSSVCMKSPEDFDALISSRYFKHKEAEEKRLEQERERIRREEQAKAEREQKEKAAAEKREAEQKAQMAEHDRLVAERAAQREESAKVEQAKPEPEPIAFIHSTPVAELEDYAWKIAGLVSTMTDKEKELVFHYCERVIAQRKEAA